VAGLVAAVSAVPAKSEPERAVVVAAAGPNWQSLSPAQQDALAPLRRDWAEIDPARRQMWLQIADLFPNLPPDERNRVQARMEDWARLSPAERLQARLNFRETRRISADQRAALWDAYLALPPEQRQALAQRARTVPPAASAAPQRKVSNTAGTPAAAGGTGPLNVQARPGASTTLVTEAPATARQAASTAPILIPPNLIDRTTLLPTPPPRKPKATRAPAASSAPAAGPASAAGPGATAPGPALATAVVAPEGSPRATEPGR
jgi:hypothetical protein